MKLEKPKCPKCGALAFTILEFVWAIAGIVVKRSGKAVYDGNGSRMDWDSQQPVRNRSGKCTVACPRGHGWQTNVDMEIKPKRKKR